MPITFPTLTANLTASLISMGIVGSHSVTLASGIAQGVTSFLPSMVVTTAHAGILGAGSGLGKLLLEPTSGASILTATLASQGLTGSHYVPMATAIALGLSTEVNTSGEVHVVITGTSTGSGVGRISVALDPVLNASLLAGLASFGMTGSHIPSLAKGLSLGITSWLGTGVVTTVDVGTPAPPFNNSAGVGIGVLL